MMYSNLRLSFRETVPLTPICAFKIVNHILTPMCTCEVVNPVLTPDHKRRVYFTKKKAMRKSMIGK